MSMPIARTVAVFYESGPEFGVPRELAREITLSASELFAYQTGTLVAASMLRSVRVRQEGGQLDVDDLSKVPLPPFGSTKYPHTLLLTGRCIVSSGELIDGSCDYLQQTVKGRRVVTSSLSLVTVPRVCERQEESAAEVVAHELGHSVGLKHCVTDDCLMLRNSSDQQIVAGQLAMRSFCDGCLTLLNPALQHELALRAA